VQTLLVCYSSAGVDTDDTADDGSDAICSNDQVVVCCNAVVKSDDVSFEVDCAALDVKISIFAIDDTSCKT